MHNMLQINSPAGAQDYSRGWSERQRRERNPRANVVQQFFRAQQRSVTRSAVARRRDAERLGAYILSQWVEQTIARFAHAAVGNRRNILRIITPMQQPLTTEIARLCVAPFGA